MLICPGNCFVGKFGGVRRINCRILFTIKDICIGEDYISPHFWYKLDRMGDNWIWNPKHDCLIGWTLDWEKNWE